VQSLSSFLSIVACWLTSSRYYYYDRTSIWPFVVSLVIVGELFIVSMAAILTLQSMVDSRGSMIPHKMWRGRKAISTSLGVFIVSALLAAIVFWEGLH
jgi:hypothetical protein